MERFCLYDELQQGLGQQKSASQKENMTLITKKLSNKMKTFR